MIMRGGNDRKQRRCVFRSLNVLTLGTNIDSRRAWDGMVWDGKGIEEYLCLCATEHARTHSLARTYPETDRPDKNRPGTAVIRNCLSPLDHLFLFCPVTQ